MLLAVRDGARWSLDRAGRVRRAYARVAEEIDVLLPYAEGGLVSRIHGEGEVLSEEHTDTGTRLRARVGPTLASELNAYLVASA